MWWMVAVVLMVVLVATYLVWSASRIDRLHARVAAAHATLDAHCVRRAALALALAEERKLPDVISAARSALDLTVSDREAAENDLTRHLRAVIDVNNPDYAPLISANRRVALARQVHTDVVRDALLARRGFIVRLVRLARRHPVPTYFDIDDPTINLSSHTSVLPPSRGHPDSQISPKDVSSHDKSISGGAAPCELAI